MDIIVPAGAIPARVPRPLTPAERSRVAAQVTPEALDRLSARFAPRSPAPRRTVVRPVLNNGWTCSSAVRTI